MIKLVCDLPKRENNAYIFSSLITGKHISEPRWAYDVILKKAGINRKEVCFLTCRHSVATALISSGRDLYYICIPIYAYYVYQIELVNSRGNRCRNPSHSITNMTKIK